MQSIHLIYIGDKAERERAMQAFLSVPESWTRFPGNILGVTEKHVNALTQAVPPIKYEAAKKAHVNGKNSPIQSS